MFGTSGVRGIVGQDVTCELAFKIGAAFGSMCKEIVIARDTRPHGRMLESALISGILFAGANTIRIGVATTPTLAYQCAVRKCGGVMITASHNPPQYNGFKLFSNGRELARADEKKIEALLANAKDSGTEKIAGALKSAGSAHLGVEWNKVGKISIYRGAVGEHSSFLLSKIDTKLIAKRAPKVLIDCGNGAGSVQTPALLAAAGCQVISLNSENSGHFNRNLEPTASNLSTACKAVVACGADFGIAHDGDADRAMLIDEKGNLLAQDAQLCIIIADILSRKKGTIVSTVEASLSVRETVARHGCKLIITPVGSIHVAEEAAAHKAAFGGEPCGEYVFADGIPCPDGPMAALKFAEIFCKKGKLSSLASKFRQYPITREKFACNNARKADAMKKIEAGLRVHGKKSALDGIRIDFDDGWLLIRPSGTESYIRLTLECKSDKKLQQMRNELGKLITGAIG
jgi:phosphoglucosamine mutase